MDAKATKNIYMVDASKGTAGMVPTQKDTIGEFLEERMGKGFDADKYLIRHGGACPKDAQVPIQDGDTISVTLTKIEGHGE